MDSGPRAGEGSSGLSLRLADVLRFAGRNWLRHKRTLLLILLAFGLYEGFHTFFAFALKLILDQLQDPRPGNVLAPLLIALGAGFVISTVSGVWAEKLTARAAAGIVNELRREMFLHLQRLGGDFYGKASAGDILGRFSDDLTLVEEGAVWRFIDALVVGMVVLVNVPLLFYLDWRLALVTIGLVPLVTAVVGRLGPPASTAAYEEKRAVGRMLEGVQESIRSQQVVRSLNVQGLMASRFDARLRELLSTSVRSAFRTALVGVSATSGVLLLQLIVTGVGALLALAGMLSIGGLVAFLNLLLVVNKAIRELTTRVLPDMIVSVGGLQRIRELLDAQPNVADEPDAIELPPLRDEIRFENVSFSYTGEAANLSRITFSIRKGQSVFLVGPSGSGKSTTLSLLMRFYDPDEGRILMDGVDLRRATEASLRRQIGAVFQETYLFDATIGENIRIARPEATDEEVEQAARLAEIHDFIAGLRAGYATHVGEGGGWLSGGQRQRIGIARALLRDPAILLLDEVTSALDPATEAALNATFARLARDRTVISVTHRLKAAQRADAIYVFRDGRLVEHGRHEDLVGRAGLYRELWEKQSGFEISQDGRFAKVTAERLKRLPLFAHSDLAELAEVAGYFFSEYHGEGLTVIRQGDVGDRFYLIARGEVEVLSGTGEAATRLAVLTDGDYFGEMALLLDEVRSASIRTLTPCVFLCLHRDHFHRVLERLPGLEDELREVARTRQAAGARPAPTVAAGVVEPEPDDDA